MINLVIPCSAGKLTVSASARQLYTGKGYFGVINRFPALAFDRAVNLGILSAEYGLVDAGQWLEPYDTQLSTRQHQRLIKTPAIVRRSKDWLRGGQAHSDELVVVAPLAYQRLLKELAGACLERFSRVTWSTGGIGEQRGLLRRASEAAVNEAKQRARVEHLDLWYFLQPGHISLKLRLRSGAMLTPWVSGIGAQAVFGAQEQVTGLFDYGRGDIVIETDGGGERSRFAMTRGLHLVPGFDQLCREMVQARGGDEVHTLELQEVLQGVGWGLRRAS